MLRVGKDGYVAGRGCGKAEGYGWLFSGSLGIGNGGGYHDGAFELKATIAWALLCE